MAVIARATTDPNIDVAKMMQLLDVQERVMAKRAEAAYVAAISAFKAIPLSIAKNRHVHFTNRAGTVTEYDHATLDEVCRAINPGLSANGLSYRWLTEQLEAGRIKVTCVLTHSGGHTERTSLMASPDDSGGKNSIQAIGSTVSYLQRYTLLAAVGIATGGADDDGRTSGGTPKTLSDDQLAQLRAMIEEYQINEPRLLKYIKVDSLADIQAEKFDAVVAEIKARNNAKGIRS